MLTRKEVENASKLTWSAVVADALAKHDALLEIYHLLGGEGEPEDVVEACKELAKKVAMHAAWIGPCKRRPDPLSQALNEGDGVYRP